MSLNFLQTYFYTQTCDVWRRSTPTSGISGPVSGTVPDPLTWTKVYSGIKWRDQTTRYNTTVDFMGLGRQDDPNFMTRNDGHFDVAYDIRDGDIIVETTSGIDSLSNSFVAVGQGEIRRSLIANYTHVDLKRAQLDPAIVTAGSYT